jgi:hypothetical protein
LIFLWQDAASVLHPGSSAYWWFIVFWFMESRILHAWL